MISNNRNMLFLAFDLLGSTKHLESLNLHILLIGGNLGALVLNFFFLLIFSFSLGIQLHIC